MHKEGLDFIICGNNLGEIVSFFLLGLPILVEVEILEVGLSDAQNIVWL